MQMNPRQSAAYRDLLNHALVHFTDTARAAGAILLNSYNDEPVYPLDACIEFCH